MATSKDLMNQELTVEAKFSCLMSYTDNCLDMLESLDEKTNGESEQNIQTSGDSPITTTKVSYTESEDVITVPAEDELEECPENEDMLQNLLKGIDPSLIIPGAKTRKEMVEALIEQFAKSDQSVSILFPGKTGVGKSSLINGLVGKKIAEESCGASPCTGLSSLQNPFEEYVQCEDKQIKITVWDSPGLLDGLDKDTEYLRQLKIVLSRVDLVVYCISMKERFEESAEKALTAFIQMKPDVLRNTVVALTQSNCITYPEEYDNDKDDVIHFMRVFQEYRHYIEASLHKCNISKDIIEALPVVPTGYYRVTRSIPNPWRLHAHCGHWLQPFWWMCLIRCKEAGQTALMMSNEYRITTNKIDENEDTKSKPVEFQPIFLHDSPSGKEVKMYQILATNSKLSFCLCLLICGLIYLRKKKTFKDFNFDNFFQI